MNDIGNQTARRLKDHRDLIVEPGNIANEIGFVLKFIWTHPANKGVRLKKIAEAFRFQAKRRLLRRPSTARIGDRSLIWVPPNVPSATRALYANPPDWPEMLVWKRRLKAGDLFVDVGANIGIYSIFMLELGASVIAVEPGARAAELLRANLELNDYEAEIFQGALAERTGKMMITIGLDTGNHLVMTETQRESSIEEVNVRTMDEILRGRVASGVKIDVEGAEFLVLSGARSALESHRIRMLQIEWSKASLDLLGQARTPIAEMLAGHGYRLFRPNMEGELAPVAEPEFGHDVFAVPSD